MQTLKRALASAMLGVVMLAGKAVAQDYICFYDHTDVYVTPNRIYIVDHYYCFPDH